MGYGFLYLMDEDTDRRVEEYSVRNNYRVRFANFSRIYLQRNDKTRTRPLHSKEIRDVGHYGPRDRPPYPPNGGRGFGRDEGHAEYPRQHVRSNDPRLPHFPPFARGPPQAMPRGGSQQFPSAHGTHRGQPDAHTSQGYHYDTNGTYHESGYYEQQQVHGPSSGEYYEGHHQQFVAHGHAGGYEDYPQSYEGVVDYHQQGHSGHEYSQHQNQGYGDQEQGYTNDGGRAAYYEGGQFHTPGVYQQGEFVHGSHSHESYAYSQQQGDASQAPHYGYSRTSQSYSSESAHPRSTVNAGNEYQGGHAEARYTRPHDGIPLQRYANPSTAGRGSFQQFSRNFNESARGGYSNGGRGRGGRGGRGMSSEHFQRRDRPY